MNASEIFRTESSTTRLPPFGRLNDIEKGFSLKIAMAIAPKFGQNLKLSKTHVTHCTSVINDWISVLPCDIRLFFSCHWCHSIRKWHQWHDIFLVIARLCIDNQMVVYIVQCVIWVFKPWKKRLHEFLKRLHVFPKISANFQNVSSKIWNVSSTFSPINYLFSVK